MRAAWLEIDLEAYRGNLRALAAHCGRPLLPVVKANGYGHGLVPIAKAAVEAGCAGLGVAIPEEGAALRAAGVTVPIVVLGATLPEQAAFLVEERLQPVVTDAAMLRALAAAEPSRSTRPEVHLKVDTGMTRVGAAPEDVPRLLQEIEALNLWLAGVMTHFASSELHGAVGEPAVTPASEQLERFLPIVEHVHATGRHAPRFHAANSGATLWFPEAWLDLVRPGLVSYGVAPAERDLPVRVRPVMSLKARVTQVRDVPAGRAVGYGGTFVTERASRLGVAPVGYADGLPWSLANRGAALVRGQRAPIRGRVSMDQVVLDLTAIPGAGSGDEAVFIGTQNGDTITAEEMASVAGTIPYEVLVRMAERLPRIYLSASSIER